MATDPMEKLQTENIADRPLQRFHMNSPNPLAIANMYSKSCLLSLPLYFEYFWLFETKAYPSSVCMCVHVYACAYGCAEGYSEELGNGGGNKG